MESALNKRPGKLSLLGLRLRYGLEIGVLRLLMLSVLFLVQVVRWLFAPAVLLVQALIMVPYAKVMRISVARSGFQLVAESEVPDDAWIYFQETASLLGLLGFRKGPFVRLGQMVGNQTSYGMPLIHPQRRIGMGVNYIEIFNGAGKTIDNRRFVEVTAECEQGRVVDFTNNEELDPFVPESRTRVRLPLLSELEMLHLFSAFSAQYGCTLPDATLVGLENQPDAIMWDEFRAGMEDVAQQGFLKPSREDENMRLTWKGAFTAGLLAQWPLSVLVGWRRGRATEALLAESGIKSDDAAMADIASFLNPLPWVEQCATSLESLLSITSPLVRGFSPQIRLLSVNFQYSGRAGSGPPPNITCTYGLQTACKARSLLRHTEVVLEIDASNGNLDWVAVDDGHYAPEELAPNGEDSLPLVTPIESLLSLQRMLELTGPLVEAHAEGRECQNDCLLVAQDGAKTIWRRSIYWVDGETIEIDVDGVSGDVLRNECLS